MAQFLKDRIPGDVVTGPGLKKLNESLFPPEWLSDTKICQPRAATIAELGRIQSTLPRDQQNSDETDFWKATPFYLRPSAAEEKRTADDALAQ